MTTSDPRTGRDDNPGERRGIGQRILDAVLGDPDEARRDDPGDTRAADPERPAGRPAGDAAEGLRGDAPRGEYSSYEQAMRDHAAGGATTQDSAQTSDTGRETARDTGSDARRDAGYDAGTTADDARRDSGQAGYADQRTAGQDTAAPWDSGYDHPGTGPDRADAVHDLPSAGAVPAGSGADRDLVTSSYDPDRDSGYDPQAAGTAVETDPAQGPVARNTRRGADADYDTSRDTEYADGPRSGASRDYDPAQDTGYVDASRAEADRTTGRRDDDYDTGRVDEHGDRVATERVDTDRADTRHGAGAAAAGAAGAGAVAAGAFGSSDRERSDVGGSAENRSGGDRSAGDREFSAVDDTATVDSTGNGRSTPDSGSGDTEAGIADEAGTSGGRERLVPAERADEYGSRWDALKGDFVDEPRRAVRQADELVGELLDELQRLFADQRRTLEQGFDHEGASTEDLRLALRRYRSFFDRLLSF